MRKYIISLKLLILSVQKWIRSKLSFIVLPGFDGMPLYDVLVFFFRGLFKGVLTYRAAAIAFNFFLALIPFILFLFTLIPFVIDVDFQKNLLELMKEMLPYEIYNLAESTIVEVVSRPSGSLLSVVFLTTLYFATNGVDAVLESFNHSYFDVEIWPWWKQKIRAFFLMSALAMLIIISLILLAFGKETIMILKSLEIINSSFTVFALRSLQWLVIIGNLLLSISVLYFYGRYRDKNTKYKFISAGSMLSTSLFVAGGLLLKLYFENFSRYNLIYGSIGSLIILLVWLYYNSIIILIGFELNASIRESKVRYEEEGKG
ncbi:MAG: YihY/virulence factor BrkB family protein [Chlorobi bacterium]|nr:YihY/virulence factor BrkB family protein [Chlorobiota bacterium]